MKSPLDERHVRTDDFQSRVAGLEFAPEVWAVFAQLEQARSANEIAPLVKLSAEAAHAAVERLAKAGLVRKQAVGWNEFASAAPAAAPASKPAAAAPSSLGSEVAGSPVISLRIGTVSSARPQVSMRLGGPAATDGKPAAAAPGWKLRPVLDAIGATAGGGVPGQLLVLKVFLQVPADLLKQSGIQSVNTVGPDFVVTDPRLRIAIIEAAKKHAKLDVTALATV